MVPGPCGRWQRRPSERRHEILAAARSVFGEEGFAKATLADVAERAGVSPATVSHYFGTKAALFEATVADEALELAADPSLVVTGAGGYRAALHAVVNRSWDRLQTPGVPELTLTVMGEMRDFPESARQLFRQVSERQRLSLTAILKAGKAAGEFDVVDPEITSHIIGALLLGAMLDLHFVAECTPASTCREMVLPALLGAVDRLTGAQTPAGSEPVATTDP